MALKIKPTGEALGASVTGVDLSRPLSQLLVAEIYQIWMDYQVLIFPDQTLTEEDQVRFTLNFGEMPRRKRHDTRPNTDALDRSIMLVTNVRENGKPIGSLPDGEMMFHSDGAYDLDPYKFTLLYAVELPSWGGDTLFANMYAAYDGLPETLKVRLAQFHGIHGYYSGAVLKSDTGGSWSGEVQHPLFIRHDDTGRTALYVSRLMTVGIAEMPGDEGQAVLDELFAHIERPENIYVHNWTVGDFVMWDNRCTVHARRDFPSDERRMLRRTTVQGIRPQMAGSICD